MRFSHLDTMDTADRRNTKNQNSPRSTYYIGKLMVFSCPPKMIFLMNNYRLNDNNILFISHIYSTRLICMTLIACFIFDIKKYQEKEQLTAAHRNEKYLSNSVCCDVARVCGGSCKIFLDFGSVVDKDFVSGLAERASTRSKTPTTNADHARNSRVLNLRARCRR